MKSLGRSAALTAIAVLLIATPVLTHHGWGGYEEKDFEITGKVESPISLSGPHASLKMGVNGQTWNVVLAPPARTLQAGLKEGIVPVGATVTAHGHRHKNPKTFEIKTERLTWGDRVFNVYPDRD